MQLPALPPSRFDIGQVVRLNGPSKSYIGEVLRIDAEITIIQREHRIRYSYGVWCYEDKQFRVFAAEDDLEPAIAPSK